MTSPNDGERQMTIEQVVGEGVALMKAGRYDAAIQLLSLTFLKTKDAERRIPIYNLIWNLYYTVTPNTVEDRSLDYILHIAEGNALRLANRQEEALERYQAAARANGRLAFSHSLMANALAFLGRYDEAHQNFARAAERARGWREGIINLDAGFLREIIARPPEAVAVETIGRFIYDDGDLVIVVGCDSRYFRTYAGPMIESIRQTCGTAVIIHIHIVDPTPDVLTEVAKRTAADERINVTTERMTETHFVLETYYACVRFLRMDRIFALYGDAVRYLIFDIDLEVKTDLRPLLDRQAKTDITFIRDDTPTATVWGRYLGGVIHIANPAKARPFFAAVAQYCEAFYRSPANRFLDQIALFAVDANKQVLDIVPTVGAFSEPMVSRNVEDNPPILYFYASQRPATTLKADEA
ncbi:MAG TPA: tetratricopeptide repeat protein [Magnetospirillaceae bacterium]